MKQILASWWENNMKQIIASRWENNMNQIITSALPVTRRVKGYMILHHIYLYPLLVE